MVQSDIWKGSFRSANLLLSKDPGFSEGCIILLMRAVIDASRIAICNIGINQKFFLPLGFVHQLCYWWKTLSSKLISQKINLANFCMKRKKYTGRCSHPIYAFSIVGTNCLYILI